MTRRRSMPWVVAGLTLALLLAINLAYRHVVDELRATLDEQLGDQLEAAAETFAATVDADLLAAAVGAAEDFSPDAYMRLREQSRDFALTNRLISATLLDTAWQDPFAESGDSLGRLIYSFLDREGQWALQSGLVWVSPTYQWGDAFYRSAAAPIIDRATGATVGIVRLEADASYFTALSRLDMLSWWIHSLSAVFAVALIALFAWYASTSRRWEAELLRSEKLIGLGRLAATIAHEIRNPLGIIKATAQRLEKEELRGGQSAERRAELLRFIPEEADRLNRILSSYLQMAAPSRHQASPVAVHEHLQTWLMEHFPPSTDGTRLWELFVEPTGPVLADTDAPRQIVINLVRNALEASPPDRPVTIRWETASHKQARLTVADHGPGVPRYVRKEIFEPFYTTKAIGTGLGLYAVKTLVERDGGRVEVGDNPGGGAVFTVYWPLAAGTHSPERME